MTVVTTASKNSAHGAMVALALNAMEHVKWRHHGIGVLQGYLSEETEPEVRIHIWSRRLLKPGMDLSGDTHDHRFDMVSHVLCGTIAHEEFHPVLAPDGDHRMMALTHARAAAANNFHGPTEELAGLYRVERNLMTIRAGFSYAFPAQHFHRSPLGGGIDDVAVTVIEKHRQRDERARILYPAGRPPVMAFGHELNKSLVGAVLTCARAALTASAVDNA